MSQNITETRRELELRDIQGNIVRAYGRFSYPFARYFFLNVPLDPELGKVAQEAVARKFVDKIRLKVTSARRWEKNEKGRHVGPKVTLNIGFSFYGLVTLGLPVKTTSGLPSEFIEGMRSRSSILGDRDPAKMASEDPNWDAHWDKIWRENRKEGGLPNDNVHMWISMNAKAIEGTDKPCPELEAQINWLRSTCDDLGVTLMSGIGPDGKDVQEANAVFHEAEKNGVKIKVPTPYEHFGLTDGIGDPVFKGQYEQQEMADKKVGRGKLANPQAADSEKRWEALETGEFILGYPDESQELPPSPHPDHLFHNGSYLVFRKLHENVGSFEGVIATEAEKYAQVNNVDLEEAKETLLGKMVGRWRNGVPLSVAPTYKAMKKYVHDNKLDDPENYRDYLRSKEISNFKYADDMEGQRCPVASHLRRTNTRDSLDPKNKPNNDNKDATAALSKRRRILRRGLPYGPSTGEKSDGTEQGVIFMTLGSSIFRQFEFVQQQWIQYGLDFNVGNSTCPMLGRHDHANTYVVPANPDEDGGAKRTFVMTGLKNFVECRGGDYFFVPSMTALAAFAMGNVDPT